MKNYQILYSTNVDDIMGRPTGYERSPETVGGGRVDYIYTACLKLRELLCAKYDVAEETFALKKDNEAAGPDRILVGIQDDAEYMEELSALQGHEYGIIIKDSKIMLLGWNVVTLEKAVEAFCELLNTCEDELPAMYHVVKPLDGVWITDFPKPDGLSLCATVDVANGCLEYIYAGDALGRDSFLAYCKKLEGAGFIALAPENYSAETGNCFMTFKSASGDQLVNVAYTPYKYANTLDMNDVQDSLRITSCPTHTVVVPAPELLAPRPYKTVCETKIVTKALSREGMCYLIQLADGSLIVIDGGLGNASYPTNADELWQALYILHSTANGVVPSAEHPIHVRAWILTHEHGDHYTGIHNFMQSLNRRPDFKLDNFIFNKLSPAQSHNCSDADLYTMTEARMAEWQACVNGGFEWIKPHTGEIFYFANMKMEILATTEDLHPKYVEWSNNASTVFRTTFTVSDEKGTRDTACVWLGDAEALPGRRLQAMWGESLKAEIVQLAHHGSVGVDRPIYDLISPTIVLYPGSKGRYNQAMNQTGEGNSYYDAARDMTYDWSQYWCYATDRYVITELPSVKRVIFNDRHTVALVMRSDRLELDAYTLGGVPVEFKPVPTEAWTKNQYYPYLYR